MSDPVFSLTLNMDLERLERAYNPENDTIPNAPKVTHTEMILLEAIRALEDRVLELESDVWMMEHD